MLGMYEIPYKSADDKSRVLRKLLQLHNMVVLSTCTTGGDVQDRNDITVFIHDIIEDILVNECSLNLNTIDWLNQIYAEYNK